MKNQNNNIVQFENVSKIFTSNNNKTIALDKVNFNIKEGNIVSFLGPNGSGKTTILKLICGLLTKTSGDVIVKGKKMPKYRNQVLRNVGLLLEGNRNIYQYLTIKQNFEYFGALKGMSKRDITQQYEYLLNYFRLNKYKKNVIYELSRGLQHRVSLAIALLSDPDLLLLDEPTITLDSTSTKKTIEYIKEFSAQKNITIVMTTHMIEVAEAVSSNIAILKSGKLIKYDKTAELIKCFLPNRYTVTLLGDISTDEIYILNDIVNIDINKQEKKTTLHLTFKRETPLIDLHNYFKDKGYEVISISKKQIKLQEVFDNIISIY